MLALILAGGEGSRLGLGEKSLVSIGGSPLIQHVVEAFEGAGCNVVIVLSKKTPYTHNWCRARGIEHYTARGAGFMEDIIEAVRALEEDEPLFTSVSDLPFLGKEIVSYILERYLEEGREALSTWVPRSLTARYGCRPVYLERICGIEACPAGVNILTGAEITRPQDELQLLVSDPRLAFNINTREDLALAQKWLDEGLM
ncbi:MAG: NTP transferase domain-containing protein [Methanolinea sp.]|nr:NTP transferase domain-containing protein [Methanolinea sp.]